MKYTVYGIVTGTIFLGEFEAVSEEEAIDITYPFVTIAPLKLT